MVLLFKVMSMIRRLNVILLGMGALLVVTCGGFLVSRLLTSPVSVHVISQGTTAPSLATAAVPSALTSTPGPTVSPTSIVVLAPTLIPIPTPVPTLVPTVAPTLLPKPRPTFVPTTVPTPVPTLVPTPVPTLVPTPLVPVVSYSCTGSVSGDLHVTYGSDPTYWVDVPVPWLVTSPIDSNVSSYTLTAQMLIDESIFCTLSVVNSDGTTTSATGSQSGQYNVVELWVCNNSEGDWRVTLGEC